MSNKALNDRDRVKWVNKETGQLKFLTETMSCDINFKTMTRAWDGRPGSLERPIVVIDEHVWVLHNDVGWRERLTNDRSDALVMNAYQEWLSFLILAAECDSE